jgi:hypothetical protein
LQLVDNSTEGGKYQRLGFGLAQATGIAAWEDPSHHRTTSWSHRSTSIRARRALDR